MRTRALSALCLLALLALPARAQTIDVPRGTGWVNDYAHVLPESERAALEARLAAFEQKQGHELALLTIPTTSGQPIENYSLAVAREWKLGKPGKNDGALLVVAVKDRKLRIEVGRGLEGELTDLVCGRVIRDVIAPRARQGDLAGGIRAGVEALISIAGGAGAKALPRESRVDDPFWTGVVVALVVLFVVVLIILRRFLGGGGGFGGRGRGFRGGLFPFPMMIGGGGGGFGGGGGGGFSGGGFGGFGGGGGFSGGGASGGW